MDQGHRSRPPGTPPPLPPLVVTEADEPEERISFVPEDDIEGGRLHVMYERLRHDDYAGAQLVAHSILEREPDNHDAWQCLEMCNVELRKLYLSRVGDLGRIPQLSVEAEELPQRVNDERAVWLLQRVNGLTTLASIVEASGMPDVEALGILSELFLRHVIEFEDE